MKTNSKRIYRKHCVVMVEGVDGVGKSTVCHELSKLLEFPIIKMPDMKKYFDTDAEKMSRFYNDIIEQFNPGKFIMDRGYPSSLVYSKVFDRKDLLDYIPAHASSLQPRIFILTADYDTIKERKKEDDIIKIDDEKRIEIDSEYKNLAMFMGWTIIDTTNLSVETICNKIIEKL